MNDFWGDLPTWITALTAVVAAIIGLTEYKSQNKVNERNAERVRREQASSFVASWVIERINEDLIIPTADGQMAAELEELKSAEEVRPKNGRWGILLRNASRATFSDINVTVSSADEPASLAVTALTPGDVFLPWHVHNGRGQFGNSV